MSIDFSAERWQKIKDIHKQWWEGELERPLIPIVIQDREPTRPCPDAPLLTQRTCEDLTIPAEKLIDRIDYEFSKDSYLGDSFPMFNMACFGPGVVAAFLGARLDNSTGRVWFHPEEEQEIADINLKFDPDNVWFRRVCDIYKAGMERWQGQVLMGMPDMGGNLDILSTFRPSEKLLFDLYDYPEEVNRLTWEINEAWHQYYEALNEVLQPVNPGYVDWCGIYSDQPTYILQCDFCYMIGPDMVESYVVPELAASCERIANPFYHLDGTGELPHLDAFLAIDSLKGVQWVPGTGKPDCSNWPDVYRKIRDAGKLIQVYGDMDILDTVGEQLGSAKGIHLSHQSNPLQIYGDNARDAISQRLEKYGF